MIPKPLNFGSYKSWVVLIAVGTFLTATPALASYHGTWQVNSTGDITSFTDAPIATSTTLFSQFLTNSITGIAQCSTGTGFTNYLSSTTALAFNVFTDGGLGATNCASVGTYYYGITVAGNPSVGVAYYELFYDGVNVTPINPFTPDSTATQYITIIQPTYGTTTASTTVPIDIYFSTPPVFLDNRPTTTRSYIIRDAVTNEIQYTYAHTLLPNSAEAIRLMATITLPVGSKILTASYLTNTGSYFSEAPSVFFNVATNTYLTATGLIDPRHTPAGQTQINCATFDVGCQVQKALQFLFLPSSTAFDRFGGLWNNIATKRPFGYVTVTISELKGLDMDATPAFTFPDLPFMDTIFVPLQVGVGSLLWALYAIHLYHRRLKTLDI